MKLVYKNTGIEVSPDQLVVLDGIEFSIHNIDYSTGTVVLALGPVASKVVQPSVIGAVWLDKDYSSGKYEEALNSILSHRLAAALVAIQLLADEVPPRLLKQVGAARVLELEAASPFRNLLKSKASRQRDATVAETDTSGMLTCVLCGSPKEGD